MSVHVEEKRFTCGTCGNSYKSSNQLRFHRKNVHDASHVPCELCGASVKNIGVHKRMVHGGEAVRKHECPYCKKRFKLKGEMNIHIRIHTGEKPFKCQLCDRSYVQKHCLKKHLQDHGKELPYLNKPPAKRKGRDVK
jgi:KRAB domain-containing zinc finger protein